MIRPLENWTMHFPKFRLMIPTDLLSICIALCMSLTVRAKAEVWKQYEHLQVRTEKRSLLPYFQPANYIFEPTWNPEGTELAVFADYGESLVSFDISGKPLRKIKRSCLSLPLCSYSIAFVGPQNTILTNSSILGEWNISSEKQRSDSLGSLLSKYVEGSMVSLISSNLPERSSHFVVDPDATRIAVSFLPPYQGKLEVYETLSWRLKKSIVLEGAERFGSIGPIIFSRDGRWLAAAVYSKLIIYDTRNWQVACVDTSESKDSVSSQITSVDFSPNSQEVALARQGSLNQIFLYKISKCQLSKSLLLQAPISSNAKSFVWIEDESIVFLSIVGEVIATDFSGHSDVLHGAGGSGVTYNQNSKTLAVTAGNDIVMFKMQPHTTGDK